MTLGQWLLLAEAVGTIAVVAIRLSRRETVTWRYAFSVTWPLILLLAFTSIAFTLFGLIAKLVGQKLIGDPNWDKPAPRGGAKEDDGLCPVCRGEASVPFDELEARAQAVIDGRSEDAVADCKLFAPIVKQFVRKHRWDREARS